MSTSSVASTSDSRSGSPPRRRDRATVQCLEPGGVGHPLPGQHGDKGGRRRFRPTRQRPVRRVVVCEARARDDVRLAGLQRGEQLAQLARIVLAVAVEAHRHVVTRWSATKASLHRGADAQVVRQLHDRRSAAAATLPCLPIRRRRRRRTGVRRGDLATTAPIAASSSYAGDGDHPTKVMRPPGGKASRSSSWRARCAYVCSSSTRSRARAPIASDWAGSASSSCRPLPRALRPRPRAARAGLEPALDLRRGWGRSLLRRPQLERAAGRRPGARVRAARDVEIDPRRGDGSSEDVERDIAEEASLPTSAWKSRPPRAKSSSGARRLGSPTSAVIHSRRNLSP